jgi:drug/metabolite transporter (DMT)-like permease
MPRKDSLPPLRNPLLLLALASLFWSGNHMVGRAIAGHVPPVGISVARWLLPAIVIWPFVRPHLQREWPQIKAHWRVLLFLGVIGGALFTTLQYVGLQYTTALNVSVLNSLVPVLIVIASGLLFRERVSHSQLGGIALSSVGVLVIIAQGRWETLRQLSFNWGDLIILFNMMMFAIYAACLRLRPPMHWLSFIFVLAAVSVVASFPFWVWEMASGITFHANLPTLAAVLYVSIFPSILAYAAWNRGVEIIGANRSGPFLHLIPIFTAVLGTFLLGETPGLHHAIGFVLILAGVWLASVKREGHAAEA